MSVQKPLSHLLTPRSGLRQRLAAYFSEGCPAVPVDGDDGLWVPPATRLAMNYGFAYRMATYAELRRDGQLGARVDREPGGRFTAQLDLRGRGRGAHAFVHRHNACRAHPAALMKDHPVFASTGQPLLLPGTNRTIVPISACQKAPPTGACTARMPRHRRI